MQRDYSIDALKAIATLLVILGHIVQYTDLNFDKSIAFKFIYSFHMPLFMFISGYFAKINDSSSILLKAKRLVLPFFLWSFLLVFIKYINLGFSGGPEFFMSSFFSIFLHPDNGGLWFLWVLFLNFTFLSFLNKLNYIFYSALFISFLYMICFAFPSFDVLGVGLFKWHYIFFFFGFLFKNVWGGEFKQQNIFFNVFIFFNVAILFSQWNRVRVSVFFGYVLSSSIVAIFATLLLKFVVAIGFIYLLFMVKDYINYNRFFVFLSNNSLGFYAAQFVVMSFFIDKMYWLSTISMSLYQALVFVVVTVICSLLIMVMDKNYWSRVYLLGKPR